MKDKIIAHIWAGIAGFCFAQMIIQFVKTKEVEHKLQECKRTINEMEEVILDQKDDIEVLEKLVGEK